MSAQQGCESDQPPAPGIGIIGAGNVGLALAVSFARHAFSVKLASRDPQGTIRKLESLLSGLEPSVGWPASLAVVEYPVAAATELCLLTVSDDLITTTCESLLGHFDDATVVGHCSGAKSSAALASARSAGLAVCSLHPLNSFPNHAAGLALMMRDHATALYCEGDEAALNRALIPFAAAGFHAQRIDKDAKELYHAASVFACNYLTTLMHDAQRSAVLAQLDTEQFWLAILPLVQTTLDNITHRGPADALSGPLARGDLGTVQTHLQALQQADPGLAKSYAELGLRTLEMTAAAARPGVPDKAYEKIATLLRRATQQKP